MAQEITNINGMKAVIATIIILIMSYIAIASYVAMSQNILIIANKPLDYNYELRGGSRISERGG